MRNAYVLTAAAAAAAILLSAPQPGRADAINPAIQKLIALDRRVRSYTADIQASIVMHSFPYLSTAVGGTYYHKQPNKDRIVFTSGVPFIAKQFSNIYPRVESPAHWNDVYVISVESDRNGVTTFRMTPRSPGRVQRVLAKIADASGELRQLRWDYTGGGFAEMNQSYANVGKYRMVTRESGHFEDANYNADVSSAFSNFKINVPIPDSVFSQ